MLEAEAEHEGKRAVEGDGDLAGQADDLAVEGAEAAEVLPVKAHVAPKMRDTNVTLAKDNIRPAEVVSAGTTSGMSSKLHLFLYFVVLLLLLFFFFL